MFRLDSIPTPEAAVGTVQVECRPMYTNGAQVAREVQAFVERNGYLRTLLRSPRAAHVYLLVSRTGDIALAALDRSSGYRELDAYALEAAQRLRFVPGRTDDVPQDVAVLVPIGFIPPQAPRNTSAGAGSRIP